VSDICNTLDSLFPPFRDQVEALLKTIESLHFDLRETYRSLATQLEYWQKGRELQNGIWVVIDKTKVVTNAQPGASLHVYGMAVDSVPHLQSPNSKLGLQWSWDDYDLTQKGRQRVPWEKLAAAYRQVGMEAGADWVKFPDLPHGQNRYGFQPSELYPILTSEGLAAVWKMLMTKVPAKTNVVSGADIPAVPVPPAMSLPQVPVHDVSDPKMLDATHDGDSQIGWFGRLLRSITLLFK
jgi:hypothetical protein